MSEKIVLIGAGSAMFTVGVVSDLVQSGEPVELALVDIDPQALEIAQRLCAEDDRRRRMPASALRAATDRRRSSPGDSR